MRGRILTCVGVLSALMLGTSAVAQETAAKEQVHRENAGTLDASGWTVATSTRGAFSVSIPCMYRDLTVIPTGDGSPKSVDVIECKNEAGFTFGAGRMAFTDGEIGARNRFEASSGESVRRGTFNGMAGSETGMAENGVCLWVRELRANSDNIVLTVMGRWDQCMKRPAAVDRFFDSVQVMPR